MKCPKCDGVGVVKVTGILQTSTVIIRGVGPQVYTTYTYWETCSYCLGQGYTVAE